MPRGPAGIMLKWLLLISALCAAVLSVFLLRIQPVVRTYAESVAQTAMLNAANNAVLEILEENDIDYSDIVVLSRDGQGTVTALETDIVKINTLKSAISSRLSAGIDRAEFYEVKIPLGTFFSNAYTNALGPKLTFKMQLTATAEVDFSHEFKAEGINQVLHIIMINMKIGGCFVTTGQKSSVTAKTAAIAAQTVIVGTVPEAFTQVIENEGYDTAGLINDYGAVAD